MKMAPCRVSTVVTELHLRLLIHYLIKKQKQLSYLHHIFQYFSAEQREMSLCPYSYVDVMKVTDK